MGAFSIVAALNKQRTTGGQAPVVLKIFIGRALVHQESLGIKVQESAWDAESRQVLKAQPNHALLNQKIRRRITELEALLLKKELLGAPLTKTLVKQLAQGADPGRSFYDFCTWWLPKKYQSPETLRTYQSEVTKLKAFRPVLHFGDLNLSTLTEYRAYMKETLGNADNTVWKSFKFINTMCNDAVRIGGILAENPLKDFDRGRYENPHRSGLTFEECARLEPYCTDAAQPVVIRMVATRFMLMCYSGLRFEDAMRFDPSEHVISGDKLQIKTQKQGVTVSLKLSDKLRQVVQLCRELPARRLSNQKFNQYLKVIGAAARIDTPLHAHLGRHTFGGLLAELDVQRDHAQRLLGHKDARSTDVYYHIRDNKLDQAMERFNRGGVGE